MTQVEIYDTTLRDGMQGEGMSLSVDEKLRVAHALDSLGVHFIEAGFPSSNPKEAAFFELLAAERFANAEVQKKIDELSRRSRGKPDAAAIQHVESTFAGTFALAHGTLSIPHVAFNTPGSIVRRLAL